MEDIKEKLIDIYENALGIAEQSFQMMGKLLDKEYLKKRIDALDINESYVYGGGYLGIQTYRSCCDLIRIPSIIDKRGALVLNIKDIPVISLKDFENLYKDEMVIVTPIKYYDEIKTELSLFVPQNKIIFLGEFLEGILA